MMRACAHTVSARFLQEDCGPPNLLAQQEIIRLREAAIVYTRKVRHPPTAWQAARRSHAVRLFVRQIETEKKRVEELDAQIRTYDAKAIERRRTMGGAHAGACEATAESLCCARVADWCGAGGRRVTASQV
jgi:hypothetical protein